jgi:hypothetical protein
VFSFTVIEPILKHLERIKMRLWKQQTDIFIKIKLKKLLRIAMLQRHFTVNTTSDGI